MEMDLMDFLYIEWLSKPVWLWIAFMIMVLALLAFDLGVIHKENRQITFRESVGMSLFYAFIAGLYGSWVWWYLGPQSGKEFYTGYLVELSLSLDNIFVINLMLGFFAIPRQYQHRVLFWGILGVIVLRGIMIGVGAALVAQFHWVLYLFAAFLIVTGVKMLFIKDHDPDIAKNPLLKYLKRHFRITHEIHGKKFAMMLPHPKKPEKIVRWYTPLFVALVMIGFADLVFAVDSVPAIFSITTDAFVVFTSNIFAILGLWSLYFALSEMIHRFEYLKPALAMVLVFIGSKVFIADFVLQTHEFPIAISLLATVGLLAGGIIFSLLKTKGKAPKH